MRAQRGAREHRMTTRVSLDGGALGKRALELIVAGAMTSAFG
jgi:hypothetical protein